MIDDVQVSCNELVLQVGSIRNHNLGALVSDNDTCSGQSDTLADPDVTGDCQVVELEDVGDRLESGLEVLPSVSESCLSIRQVVEADIPGPS